MDATARAPAADVTLLPGWAGTRVQDADGAPVGRVADVLFDRRTRAPGWLLVALGDRHALAPACGLRHLPDGIRLACTARAVRDAPGVLAPPDGLGHRDAVLLARHFGVRCGAGPWDGALAPRTSAVPRGSRVAAVGA